jgi:hypothetical protein
VASYPIESKADLIAALATLEASELDAAGLKKKGGKTDSKTDSGTLRAARDQLTAQQKINAALQEQYTLMIRNKELSEEEGGLFHLIAEEILGSVDNLEEATDRLETFKQLAEATDGAVGGIASSLGVNAENSINKGLDNITGGMVKLTGAVANINGNFKAMAFSMAASLLQQVKPALTTVASGILEMTKVVMLAFDKAQANLNATTGATYAFNDALYDSQRSMNILGVSFAESSEAISTLNRSLGGFNTLNTAAKVELTTTTTALGKLGVNAQTSADLLSFFKTNLKLSIPEAARATKQLAMLGTAIGIDPAKMAADFTKANSSLAVYGSKAVDVYKNIASAAKAAEVGTEALLGLAAKFDTFESAADTTAKLNAIMGSQMSALELLNQKEDQRIETLIRSTQASGTAFADMDRFTQKAIAAAAGISDLNEAQKIFGMNLSQYNDFTRKAQESADIQQDLNNAIKAAIPLGEKFKIMATEFLIALGPAFEYLTIAADFVIGVLKGMDDTTKKVIGTVLFLGSVAIAGLISALSVLVVIVGQVSAFFGALGTWLAGGTLATKVMGKQALKTAGEMQVLSAVEAEAMLTTLGLGGAAGAATPVIVVFGKAGKGAGKGISAGMMEAAAGIGIAVAAAIGLALAIGLVVGAIATLVYAYAQVAQAEAQQEEAKARQIEGYMNLNESISQIEASLTNIAAIDLAAGVGQIELIAAALKGFDDVSIETKHTLTNLALIKTGTASEVMTGARATANNINVENQVQNAINLDGIKVEISIAGQSFENAVMRVINQP